MYYDEGSYSTQYNLTDLVEIPTILITPPSLAIQQVYSYAKQQDFLPVKSSAEIRCYGCRSVSSDCTVPCKYPQKCFIRAADANATCMGFGVFIKN